jgi:hypothetical protein
MFAPHRRISQLTTSFIACLCQGIRLVPLLTWLKILSISADADALIVLTRTRFRLSKIAAESHDAAWYLHPEVVIEYWLTTAGTPLCGEYRARTGDLLVANQALSQLS